MRGVISDRKPHPGKRRGAFFLFFFSFQTCLSRSSLSRQSVCARGNDTVAAVPVQLHRGHLAPFTRGHDDFSTNFNPSRRLTAFDKIYIHHIEPMRRLSLSLPLYVLKQSCVRARVSVAGLEPPYPAVGFIEKNTGKVELEVDADVILSAKPLYTSASVRVPLTLTTETSWGATRSARGKRLDSEGRCVLVAVARVPPVSDLAVSAAMMLPSDVLVALQARFEFGK